MTESKHELTEKLKVFETEIYDESIDLKGIINKLEVAYAYEEELAQRMVAARLKTNRLQEEVFVKSGKITELHKKMKDVFNIFTGNFFKKV